MLFNNTRINLRILKKTRENFGYLIEQYPKQVDITNSDGHTFFTDQDATGFGLSASKSRITPPCCVDVSSSGQLRRERTANSLPYGEQHAAVKRKKNSYENEIKCAHRPQISFLNTNSMKTLKNVNTDDQLYCGNDIEQNQVTRLQFGSV